MRVSLSNWLRGIAISLVVAIASFGGAVHATSVSPPPVSIPDSPLIISAYANNGSFDQDGNLVSSSPAYLEIYNTSDGPIYVDDWHIIVRSSDIDIDILLDSKDYIIPHGYSILSFNGIVRDANFETSWDTTQANSYVEGYSIAKSGYEPYVVDINDPEKKGTIRQELNTTTTGYTTTGKYHDDERSTIYQNEPYLPRISFPLAPIEILPNSEHCPPNDTRVTCGDYVKFYNNTGDSINFSGIRLRIGYKGQAVTKSNTIPLGGVVADDSYVVFNKTIDGSSLNITNSGGYVWLEDIYGITLFDNTIVSYPSASSTKHTGQSWAYDGLSNEWNWAIPTPFGVNRMITDEERVVANVSSLKPCNADQYRNPETNRCKKLASSSSLTACRSDQYRNPETNRCKSSSAVVAKKACRADQYRNPETGRCKLNTSSNSLKPCKAGWERNKETNRCRKIKSASANVQGYAVEKVTPEKSSYLSWWIATIVGLLILARIIWEWHVEIGNFIRRLIRIKR